MKKKKVLCKLLVASLLAGTISPGVAVNTVKATNDNMAEAVSVAATDFEFDVTSGTITKYTGQDNEVVVPTMIDGIAVKTIGADAFASNDKITSVVISEGVVTIGEEAFLNCPNLKSVVIPNGVANLGQLTFFMCEKLESVTLGHGITEIGRNTFYGCKSLKTIQLPDSVSKIGDYAFMGCSSLNKITIPSSVTTIVSNAFDRDSKVEIICEAGSKAYEYAHAYGFKNTIDSEDKTVTPATKKENYTITYVLNKGKLSKTAVKTYDGTVNVTLPNATKKGYLFKGWYEDSSYKKKVTAIKKGTTGNKTFYAKWEKVKKPSKPSISKVSNTKSKQMSVKLKKKVSGAKGYEMVYATDKKFKKNKKTTRFTGTSKTVKKLKKGKTYYVKVRAYKLDSGNERVYGSYSSVKKVKIKK